MNEFNYASREAAQRLQNAGIVLETEAFWVRIGESPFTLSRYRHGEHSDYPNPLLREVYPAPMFTEVWRELPEWYDRGRKTMVQQEGKTSCGYLRLNNSTSTETYISTNPTDALIDLLVWLGKEKV